MRNVRSSVSAPVLTLIGLVASVLIVACAPSPDVNKAVARNFFEVVLNNDNWAQYLAVHTKDFVAHAGTTTAGTAEDLAFAKEWRKAFPDGKYTVDRVVAEGDMVVVQYTGRGTNTGAGNGLPATGHSIAVTGVTIFRMENGKIAEEWNETDMLGLLRQLGLMPARQ